MAHTKTFFFAITTLFVIGFISTAYADEPISNTRYRNYQLEKFADGTERQTLGLVPYVWDGSKFVDRIIQNNSTHFNVYSEMGSFSFSKSDCTITQYVQGFDPTSQQAHDSDIVIKDWFWTIARKNGANPWQVIDATLFDCAISTSTNSTGKYLTMTRTDVSSGSELKVVLAAPNGKPVEDFASLYMNKTSWAGNKFAFVLWAKDVNTQTITYRNASTVPIQDGVTIIDKSQLTTDSLDFVKNGNAFFVDWSKAKTQFKTLLLNKTGSNLDVQFGFNDNAVTLNQGQSISLDPTYGYTAGTSYTVNTGAGAGAACPAYTTTLTTRPFYIFRYDSADAGGICGMTAGYWDVSSIPANVVVSDVKVRFDVDTVLNPLNCSWRAMSGNPSSDTAAVIAADILDGTLFLSGDTSCASATTNKIVDLGTGADADLQTKRSTQSFWSVGVSYDSMVRDGTTRSTRSTTAGHTMDLQVVYKATTPPDAITDLSAADYDSDSADLTFSAPSVHDGTLQVYVFNYTTPCGEPLTVLPNGTTATAYTVSGLTAATCYSFRASAATEFGFNASGNIINVTTLAFNQANFTIGSFNFDATNPLILPIRYERDDLNSTHTLVNVTFANTVNLACDLRYTYAGTNQTYFPMSSVVISSTENESSFRFINYTNEITTFHCWDYGGNVSANYVLTQTDFLLLQQIDDFRNGTYGTMGQLGAFDFLTLIIIIISMIGMNRTTPAVAGFFAIVAIAVLAFFEIIVWWNALVAGVAVVTMLAVASTRKEG